MHTQMQELYLWVFPQGLSSIAPEDAMEVTNGGKQSGQLSVCDACEHQQWPARPDAIKVR